MKNLKPIQGYTYGQLLGSGAYADVFKCTKNQTGQIFAVKLFKALKHNQPDVIKKQINIVRKLNHPNIVKCYDVFQENNKLYAAVFQYCGKGNLQDYLYNQNQQKNKIPQNFAKSYIYKILDALVQMHKNKIVHRDLKLANILINDQYQVKLADFGLSKSFQQVSMLSTFCGTPLTMAPQVLSQKTYTSKCDTWSFGIISYCLLFSQYPFTANDPRSLLQVIQRHKAPKFPKNSTVSQQARQFISECLTFDPQKRPSIQQLLDNKWFMIRPQSQIRSKFMKQSLGEQQTQIMTKTNNIIIYSINKQVYKIITQMNLTQHQLNLIKKGFNQLYPDQKNKLVQFFYFLGKKIKTLNTSNILLKLGQSKFKLKPSNLKKLDNHIKNILSVNQQRFKTLSQSISANKQDVNLQRSYQQLVKFVVQQGLKFVEQDEQNLNKIRFYKNLLSFLNTEIQNPSVIINLKSLGKSNNKQGMKDMRKQKNMEISQYNFEQGININEIKQQFNTYVYGMLNQQKICKLVNKQSDKIINQTAEKQIQKLWTIQYINPYKTCNQLQTYRLVGQTLQGALKARQLSFSQTDRQKDNQKVKSAIL